MKIGFDITTLSMPRTGIGQYQYNLLSALFKIDRENQYNLYAFNLRDNAKYSGLNFNAPFGNVRMHAYKIPQRLITAWWMMVRWPYLENITEKCDVYQISEICQQPTRAKTVAFIHDITTILYPQYHLIKNKILYHYRFKGIKKYANAVLTNSENTKQDIIEKIGIPAKRIFVTPFGVHERFRPLGKAYLERKETNYKTANFGKGSLGQGPLGQSPLGQGPLGQGPLGQNPLGQGPLGQNPLGQGPLGQNPLGQSENNNENAKKDSEILKNERIAVQRVMKKYGIEEPYICYLGTIEPRKNLENLLEAFYKLKHQEKVPHKLVLIGKDGWFYEKIYQKIDSLKLNNEIVRTGFADDEEIPYLLNGAEVFVYPSFYEGFGLPVLEAMACGVPVVTSPVSSLPEVGGNAVKYASPFSSDEIAGKILSFIKSEDERNKFANLGLARAGHFTWEKCARETLKIYQSL